MACEHVFVEQKRTFVEPILTIPNLAEGLRFQGSPEETARALYGFTTIELCCTLCGALEFYTNEGDLT